MSDTDEEVPWAASEIEDRLYLGSIADATNTSGLTEHRITTLISVHDEAQDPPDSVKHVHFKCADRSDANLLKHMGRAANAVALGLHNGGNVLVHCLEGRSRSSSLICAYLIMHRQMSLRDAFALVKRKREDSEPNRGFWRQLVAFERGIRGQASLCDHELPGCVMFEQSALDLMIAEHQAVSTRVQKRKLDDSSQSCTKRSRALDAVKQPILGQQQCVVEQEGKMAAARASMAGGVESQHRTLPAGAPHSDGAKSIKATETALEAKDAQPPESA